MRRGNWVTRKADPNQKSASALERAGKGAAAAAKGGRGAARGAPSGRGAGGKGGDEWSVAGGKPGKGGKGDVPPKGDSGPSVAAPPPQPKLKPDEVTDKIEQNLEEYFGGAGLEELLQCTRDLQPRVEQPDELGKQLLQIAMAKGFDARSDEQREKVGRIFGGLSRANLLKPATLKMLFDETLEFIEDDVVDIPHVATYMAQYIAHAVSDGAIKLSFINEGFAHLVEAETISATRLACGVLRALRTAVGDDAKVSQMYADSCELFKCMPPGSSRAELAKLLETEQLTFIDPQLSVEMAKAREAEQTAALEEYLKGALGEVHCLGIELEAGPSGSWIRHDLPERPRGHGPQRARPRPLTAARNPTRDRLAI